ncbi:MAG: PHP domain-containing protein, partial [Candidatus Ventricola sp.]
QCASLAEQYGLRWRYVSEAYFVKDRNEKDNTNCHIILAAKTRKGVGDLNYILSEANISGYYYRPRIDLELLMSLDPRDVFVTTACIAGVFKYGYAEAERLILRMAAHFRDSFMLEVQYHDTDRQREVNEFLLKLYRKHGIPLIMGTDSHFIHPEDAALREHRLEANHIRYEDEGGWYMDYPSGAEAFRRFQEQGVLSDAQIREAMENTNVFLSFEDIVFDKSKKLPTIYPQLTQEQRNQKYMDLILGEFDRQTAGMSEDERAVRMEGVRYETDVVTSTGMSDYFLLDHEIVRRAVEKGGVITKTGRGSCPSYYTNALLGLSSIDRFAIPVEMFPDRFISADRIRSGSLPDIDMNVANREAFEAAQAEVLGEWRAAPMVAFGTLKRLSAWKMYCRAADIPFETANEVGSQLKAYESAVRFAEDGEEVELSDYVPPQFRDLVAASERYMGMIDSISPHPCAYLLCTEDIRREIGVIRINSRTGKKQPVFAAFIDGATAEQYGYLKNDLLLVDVVRVNQEAFHRIGMAQPDVSALLEMTRNDRDTWRMYAEGYTMGLNQVEQEKTREKVMRYKPKNITELAAFVAAVRPAFKSMLPTFLDRRHFDYGIPAFDRLIQTREMTSSFLLYQEQTMKTLQFAGFSAPESYAAIKAIAKKHPEKVLPLKERFLEGFAAKADMPSAEKVWKIIEDATSYGFN